MNKTVTYSPAYTLVPTYQCFNRCSYCNFRTDIDRSEWLTVEQAREQLQQHKLQNISEILILSGEVHPLSEQREGWFKRIYQLCLLALALDFLPHTNAGILSWEEMKQLKQVNVSMGLMLEQLNPKLLKTVHKYSPSKVPELRLQQIEWAGELKIPFTTGLLLGIGETETDWWESLDAIANLQAQWGHIQEVILQPYSLGSQQEIKTTSFSLFRLPEIISKARAILPDSITIQIPPNLIIEPNLLLECLEAGARDLGGISPKDEVNPDYPHPIAESLKTLLESANWELVPRLPVYPQYYSWLSLSLQQLVKAKEKALRCHKSINRK
jgi:FO synthase subunit 1